MKGRTNKKLFLITLTTLIFINIGCVAEEKINIGFSELQPYMSASLEKHGVTGLLLDKALAEKGTVQLTPITAIRLPYLLNAGDIAAGVTIDNDLCSKTTEFKCSEVIKLVSVILAYRPENIEFNNVTSLNDLKKDVSSIGQPKEYVLFDTDHNQLKFKAIKDVNSGFKLLTAQRLKGFLVNEDIFDYNKVHNLIDPAIHKSKPLLQIPIRIIVKNNDKYQWIIQNINNYIQKNPYDSIWLDYYLNYATANN